MNIGLVSTRGGVGTTTIAVAIAAKLGGTVLARTLEDAEDVLASAGMPPSPDPLTPHKIVFGDGTGCIVADNMTVTNGRNFLVVRGPDYGGVRRAMKIRTEDFSGVIVVAEAGRSLDPPDVAAVLDLPVLVVPSDPAIARAVDAGLLAVSLPKALAPLVEQLCGVVTAG
jgi:hypothetical protein